MRILVLLVLLVVCGPVAPAAAAEWRWPLDGRPSVARPFAAPAHRYAAGHRGADLPASPGAAVRAAGAGVVSYAGLVAGRGVVAVVHGDLRTTYEPVSALLDVGSSVAAGEIVGVLEPGHLGCPVLTCLHWGLRRGDDYLDPVRLVVPGPVRLLPLEGSVAGVAAGAEVAEPVRPAVVSRPVRGAARAVEAPDADGPVLAPGEPPGSRTADVGLAATAGASLLGAAAAVGAARRRRR